MKTLIRETHVRFEKRLNSFIEDTSNGKLPAIIIEDNGIEKAVTVTFEVQLNGIVVYKLYTAVKTDSGEYELLQKPKLRSTRSDVYVDVSTGEIVDYETAFTEGVLNTGYRSEYDFFYDIFMMNGTPMYDMLITMLKRNNEIA